MLSYVILDQSGNCLSTHGRLASMMSLSKGNNLQSVIGGFECEQIQKALASSQGWVGEIRFKDQASMVQLSVELVPLEVPCSPTVFLLSDSRSDFQSHGIEVLKRAAHLLEVGELASSITHEINTPLAVILGKLTIMKRVLSMTPADLPKVLEDISQCEKQTNRIGDMVRGIRNISRGNSLEPFASTTVEKIFDNIRSICEDKAIRWGIKFEMSGQMKDSVHCREYQISQVLLNLINNSYEEVRNSQEKWVKVEWQNQEPFFVFRISDSGPGISPKVLPNLMDAFVTGRSSGSGLGLNSSLQIVRQHGGELILEKANSPTTFVVRLPHRH